MCKPEVIKKFKKDGVETSRTVENFGSPEYMSGYIFVHASFHTFSTSYTLF